MSNKEKQPEPETTDAEATEVEDAPPEPTIEERAEELRAMTDEDICKLEDLARDRERYEDLARRSQAELDNTVKRIRREHGDFMKYAHSSIVRELLPVLDNLRRGIDAAEKSDDMATELKTLLDGVKMTYTLFLEALAKHDVEPISAQGEQFDPNLHEALLTASSDEHEDNIVVVELEQGWKLLDRVIRATKVQVNKKG
ncbi:MAG: nucleotide exchange factor GrpE [Planctomycetota bacterium]|jgi:molecular chaperone GrpE